MVVVPEGIITLGSSRGSRDEQPEHEVYVSGFEIDTYEVTVLEYTRCIRAGKCSFPDTDRYDFGNFGVSGREKHPINNVSWEQARTYCAWERKRLPTEAEWEKAARGTDGRAYPWGNDEANCSLAAINDGGIGCGKRSTWEVGSKPADVSPYGVYDLAGNVHEWTADWYDEDYYSSSPAQDPKGPAQGSSRVYRGGSCWSNSLPSFSRGALLPSVTEYSVGFRCVKSLY